MTAATYNNNTTPINLPPVRNLNIDGIKPQNVNETRIAYLNAMKAMKEHGNKPAGTKKLAEVFIQQQQKKSVKPVSSFRVVETKDLSLGMMMTSKAVEAGLERDETVVIVSPQSADHIRCKLEMTGLDIESHMDNRKLIILSTQSDVDVLWNEKTYYKGAFDELFSRVNRPVDRIILLDVDQILDLHSQHSAYITMEKFTRVMDEMGCKVIAQYSRKQNEAHDCLDSACSSLVPAYFVMSRAEEAGKYRLRAKNHSF